MVVGQREGPALAVRNHPSDKLRVQRRGCTLKGVVPSLENELAGKLHQAWIVHLTLASDLAEAS
jgi:hypothetical protein